MCINLRKDTEYSGALKAPIQRNGNQLSGYGKSLEYLMCGEAAALEKSDSSRAVPAD